MSAWEAQLFFSRALLLILFYSFLGAVAWVSWRELRAQDPTASRSTGAPTPRPDPARLILLDGGASTLAPGTAFPVMQATRVGRELDNDVVLRDPSVSAHHAVIVRRDGAWWVEDLASTNGSWLNGESLASGTPVLARSGDLVQVGGLRMRLVHHEL